MQPYPPPPTPPHSTFVALSAFSASAPDAWLIVLLAILLALALLFIALWALRGNPIARVSMSFAPPRNALIEMLQFIIAIPVILFDAVMLYVNLDALKSLARYCIEFPRAVWTIIIVTPFALARVWFSNRRQRSAKNKSLTLAGEPISKEAK